MIPQSNVYWRGIGTREVYPHECVWWHDANSLESLIETAMNQLESQTLATTLYVSLFGRAPDKSGLAYWSEKLQGGLSLQSTVGYFLSSDEGQALYGVNMSSAFVDSLYQNTLGRTDPAGVQFWQSRLVELGNRNELVEQFIKALQGGAASQSQLFSNKVDFGLSFAASKSGDNVAYAKILLANVTADPASLSQAKLVNEYVDNPPPPPPSAPTLTLHADTGVSASDGITSNTTIDIRLPTGVQSWSYSVDNGVNWNAGTGTSFSLLEGTYLAGKVQAKYISGNGIESSKVSTASDWVIDTTGPTFSALSQTITQKANNPSANVARVSVEFNENIYVGNTSNIAFFLDNTNTITVGFVNQGVLSGKLTLDGDVGLAGRSVAMVLPTGMVLDAAGNPSHALNFGDVPTFIAVA